jgi:hypothetical protein
MILAFLAKHEGTPKELKTKVFINGSGGWSKVDPAERKAFLGEVCDLAVECARVFAVSLSFERFEKAADAGYKQPFGKSYWLAAAMFIAALVQQKMQKVRKNKGLTVFICDDNKREMQNLSDGLYESHSWFDPIYQKSKLKQGKTVWKDIGNGERFDHIVNSAFAIKSEHSSLVQVADAVSYVFRRHLELKSVEEAWEGEREYFAGLAGKLEPKRERLGRTPGGACIEFYESACHKKWRL